MANRKALGSAIFVPVLIGSIGLLNITHKQRFELFHTVDVLQLIASGMCYGVALAAFIALIRGSRT
ncbi:MAG TPA: hypothetical protein VLX32_09150 [Candidatus Acidoferrum sp.]|nr:hypothetical protein [Candidatus Acidoferrum sp.]